MNEKWITKPELMNRITLAGCKLKPETLNSRLSAYTAKNLRLFHDYLYSRPRRTIVYNVAVISHLVEHFTTNKRSRKCKQEKS